MDQICGDSVCEILFGIVWKENIIRTENINKNAFLLLLCKLYNRGRKHNSRIYK
jgi:hypothetical protein